MVRPPRLSLLQRFFYVAQTSYRRMDSWLEKNMVGLPNPPMTEEEIQEKEREKIVDLWTLTLADHVRFAREAFVEWKQSFREDYKFRDAGEERAEKIKKMVQEQQEKMDEHVRVHHPELNQEIHTWKSEIKKGVQDTTVHLKTQVDDIKTQAKDIDVDRIPEHIADAVNAMKDRPVADVKKDFEEWALDKLMVGRMTMMAFVEGYKEGKTEEMARETPLLKELAERATERHKDFLLAKRDELVQKVVDFDAKIKSPPPT
ncbi:Aste57867_3976 [Aphanomyces stellatus]|uniref:Aste57867_3976 protein n=1 Tax=Aphanomyces stellatus TaxID=120398 RepID=A0A485KG27_9STRA|nr:hypothetical protein As57867_003965 [Aphanomyces stellatus]VFT81113.1 Aste57867_3976 [Aphanomyces stellatus]